MLQRAGGASLVTLEIRGTERRVELAGGKTLIGDAKEKDRQKTVYRDGAVAAYEIKEGDAGFKLRDGAGKLLWKVKLQPEKVKISDNEEGLRPFELIPKDGGRIKLKREDKELGKAECRPGKVKIEDEADKDRFEARTERCSGVGTLLLIEEMTPEQRAILMAEIWARGR